MASPGSVSIGIIGASGFTGAELLRLCALHPDLEVRFATGDTQAGTAVADLYPSLAAAYPDTRFQSWSPDLLDGVDGVFLGLPHGASQAIVPDVVDRVKAVVDLGADFRLPDGGTYEQWYGEAHTQPDLLDRFAYGLPELNRQRMASTDCIAAPGCYPTAASLALAPLVRAGVVETTGVIVDAVSGVSGAGRPPKPTTTFCAVDEDVTAYGLLDHRHTAEMEMNLGASVLFTPHLVPMNRGILATCYARPARSGLSTEELLAHPGRLLRRRTVRGRVRAIAVDQGDPRVQRRPPDGPPRRADRHRARASAPSTTSARARRARPSSA